MTFNTRRSLPALTLFGLILIGTGMAVHAADGGGQRAAEQTRAETYSRAYLHSYNLDNSGLAIEGYCPVTYQTHGVARLESAEYASTYNGVDYQFVSAAAKHMFDDAPREVHPRVRRMVCIRHGDRGQVPHRSDELQDRRWQAHGLPAQPEPRRAGPMEHGR